MGSILFGIHAEREEKQIIEEAWAPSPIAIHPPKIAVKDTAVKSKEVSLQEPDGVDLSYNIYG